MHLQVTSCVSLLGRDRGPLETAGWRRLGALEPGPEKGFSPAARVPEAQRGHGAAPCSALGTWRLSVCVPAVSPVCVCHSTCATAPWAGLWVSLCLHPHTHVCKRMCVPAGCLCKACACAARTSDFASEFVSVYKSAGCGECVWPCGGWMWMRPAEGTYGPRGLQPLLSEPHLPRQGLCCLNRSHSKTQCFPCSTCKHIWHGLYS